MSIANICVPNNLTLYCGDLITSGDVNVGSNLLGTINVPFLPINGTNALTAAQVVNQIIHLTGNTVTAACTLPSAASIFAEIGASNIHIGTTFQIYLSYAALTSTLSLQNSSDGSFTAAGTIGLAGTIVSRTVVCRVYSLNPADASAIIAY
jgi:hypothetical protein